MDSPSRVKVCAATALGVAIVKLDVTRDLGPRWTPKSRPFFVPQSADKRRGLVGKVVSDALGGKNESADCADDAD